MNERLMDMKKVALLLLIALLITGCSSHRVEKMTGSIEEISQSYISDLEARNTDQLLNNYHYSVDMENALTETVFDQIYADLDAKFGNWIKTEEMTQSEQASFTILTYHVIFENADINMNIVFDTDKNIAGLNYTVQLAEMTAQTESTSTEVTFGNAPHILSGTLTIPAGEGPFPALVLVHGSGPNDRDETLMQNKPFLDIATYLTDHGIAVLRYDKRTFTYGKDIDVSNFTPYDETIEDAALALDFLSSQAAVDSSKIFILGHSLGGYLLPKIAEVTPGAAGYIFASAPVTSLEDLIVYQYEYIFNLDSDYTDEEKSQVDALKSAQSNIHALTNESTYSASELMGIDKNYWLYLKDYNPTEAALKISQPMLFIQGERDYQVPINELYKWQTVLENHPEVTFNAYPGVNHLLYIGQGTPSPAEYSTPGHVSDTILDDITSWIKNN